MKPVSTKKKPMRGITKHLSTGLSDKIYFTKPTNALTQVKLWCLGIETRLSPSNQVILQPFCITDFFLKEQHS